MTKVLNVTVGRPKSTTSNGTISYAVNLKAALEESCDISTDECYIYDFIQKKFYTRQIYKSFPKITEWKDVVIFHGYYNMVVLLLIIFCKSKNILWLPHGGVRIEALKKRSGLKRLYIFISKAVIKLKSVSIVVASEAEIASIKDFLGVDPYVLPPSTGSEILKHQIKSSKVGTQREVMNVLYLGRYDLFGKGLDTLLQVADHLKHTQCVNFILHGPSNAFGSSLSTVKQFQKDHGLEGNIKYCDAVYGEKKYDTVNDCDVGILLSRSEGFPMTLIECLALGKPVIATRETNFIGHGQMGPIINVQRDPFEISNAILDIYDKMKKTNDISTSATNYYNKHFSNNYIVGTFKGIINKKSLQ